MTTTWLDLTRPPIVAFRRRAGSLDERLPPGKRSLRRAAWAGLQDSMPRAALLSIHARVEGTSSAHDTAYRLHACSTAGRCRSTRPVARWACSQTAFTTQLLLAR